MLHSNKGVTYGPLAIVPGAIKLPNGMFLKYPHLNYYLGDFLYTQRIGRAPIRTHGPRVCENVVQALSRIVITDQLLNITSQVPEVDVVLTVHDEIICIGPDKNMDFILDKIMAIMKIPPEWCQALPLDAEGGYSKVYDK